MPREKRRLSELMRLWIEEETENFRVLAESESLHCMICNIVLHPVCRSDVIKHLRSQSHITRKCGESSRDEDFKSDLTKAFLCAKIPLGKLNNPHLRLFLETFTGHEIPHRDTLRKIYVDRIYTETVNEIRKSVGDKYVWISIDEFIDDNEHHIGNFIVGALEMHETKAHLLASKHFKNTQYETIVEFVNQCLHFLWDYNYSNNISKVLLLLTNLTEYMLKAGKVLKLMYPNLYHVTCLTHALDKTIEQIENKFLEVSSLITIVNEVFSRSSQRRKHFQGKLPDILLPPELQVLESRTWLQAVIYYAEHLQQIKNVVYDFDAREDCVTKAQVNLSNSNHLINLTFIKNNFSILASAIQQLEASYLPLKSALQVLDEVIMALDSVSGDVGSKVKHKFEFMLAKNPDLRQIRTINHFLNDSEKENLGINSKLAPYFKFCPITCVKVERSLFLSTKNCSYSMNNLEKHIVISYNYKDKG